MLKIFLVETKDADYGEFDGFIVSAINKEDALKVINKHISFENSSMRGFKNKNNLKIKELKPMKKRCVIFSSYIGD